eukprot:gene20127-25527_t
MIQLWRGVVNPTAASYEENLSDSVGKELVRVGEVSGLARKRGLIR